MTTAMRKRPENGMPALARAAETERRRQRTAGRETLRETMKLRGFDFAPLADEALALGLVEEMARILSSSKIEQIRERGRELLAREYERLGGAPDPAVPVPDEKGAGEVLSGADHDEASLVDPLPDFLQPHDRVERLPAEVAVDSAVSKIEGAPVPDAESVTDTVQPAVGVPDEATAPSELDAPAQTKSSRDPGSSTESNPDGGSVLEDDRIPDAPEATDEPAVRQENHGSRWTPGAVAMPAFRARSSVPLPFRATRSDDLVPLDPGREQTS